MAASPEPAQAARARVRCSSIAASKPARSTVAALLAQRVLRQVEREAEGVVEPERHRAGQGLAVAEPGGFLGQQMQAALQHGLEARLLQQQRLDDQRLGAHQFGIGGAHLAHQRRHQPVHHRLARAHHVGVAHGAAHDPAQHVAAALVRRQHAVGDQERRAAQMVGDHAMADAERAVRVLPGGLGAGQDQRAEDVGVVVVVLALQDGGDALQPHAGVDRGPRQRHARAGRAFLELHEHQVPDLDEAVAVRVRRCRADRPEMSGPWS